MWDAKVHVGMPTPKVIDGFLRFMLKRPPAFHLLFYGYVIVRACDRCSVDLSFECGNAVMVPLIVYKDCFIFSIHF